MDYEQDEQEEQYEEVQAEPQAEAMEIDEKWRTLPWLARWSWTTRLRHP